MKRETERLVVAALAEYNKIFHETDESNRVLLPVMIAEGLDLAARALELDSNEASKIMKARQEKAKAGGIRVGRNPVDCPNGEYLAGKIEKGISVGTLARQYGVSRGTIGNRVREWKVAKNLATGQVEEEIILV